MGTLPSVAIVDSYSVDGGQGRSVHRTIIANCTPESKWRVLLTLKTRQTFQSRDCIAKQTKHSSTPSSASLTNRGPCLGLLCKILCFVSYELELYYFAQL